MLAGLITNIVRQLQGSDASVIKLSLNVIDALFNIGEHYFYLQNCNSFQMEFDSQDGQRVLESLQYHDNLKVANEAVRVMQRHYECQS